MSNKTRVPNIRMVKKNLKNPSAEHRATKEQKQRRLGALEKIRRDFLKLSRTLSTATSVVLIIYLTATVLIPAIGGTLSEAVGLSGQVHYYNMLQSWGFPMLCITGVVIIGDFYLCKHIVKIIREFFQIRIDEGITETDEKN